MSFVGPQDAIRGMIEELGSSGVFPSLQSLGDYDGTGGGALAELTDRQRLDGFSPKSMNSPLSVQLCSKLYIPKPTGTGESRRTED